MKFCEFRQEAKNCFCKQLTNPVGPVFKLSCLVNEWSCYSENCDNVPSTASV